MSDRTYLDHLQEAYKINPTVRVARKIQEETDFQASIDETMWETYLRDTIRTD